MPTPEARYASWIDRNRIAVLVASLAIAVASGIVASGLSIRPDLSNLLPPSAKSVKDLRALEKRARAFGSMFVVVESDDPELRQRATRDLYQRLLKLDHKLLSNVAIDDRVAREYFWKNRFLFADLDDIVSARDALKERIREAKLEANPLYVDLDDEPDSTDLDERVASLRERLDKAEHEAEKPASFVSHDGRMQLLVMRAPFQSSDFVRSIKLLSAVDSAIHATGAEVGPGVRFGPTGNIVTSLNEQHSIMRGMFLAAIITIVLCAFALFLYYRSVLTVAASLWSLAVGTLLTFAIAKLTIGYLNLVTAFLAAIVVGNGINSGLILLARYNEEVHAGRMGNDGLGAAVFGAARGTFAAAITAGTAYASLIVTDFRGFRHFGIIGGLGMALCWISAFTVLPAALCVLRRRGRIRPRTLPAVGRILARLMPERVSVVVIGVGALTLVAGIATWRYVAADPLQEDWRNLRPHGPVTKAAEDWYQAIRDNFDERFRRGMGGRFVVGLPTREEARRVASLLRAADKGKPPEKKLFNYINTLDDLLPSHEQKKLALLTEIRTLLDGEVADDLSPEDRKTAERIRPPPDLTPLTDADVPEQIAWPFIEKDGTRGRLILASSAPRFKTWNVHDRVEFAEGVRALDLPDDALIGGQSFIFADMIESMAHDGPLASVVALLGAVLVVVLVVGVGRHGLVTLVCGAAGILGMIALVSAFGVKVNVIDFIALPITIGIGIDYAVNIAARERQDGHLGPRHVLETTGGAVLLCSFTTMVGYGSLLLSDSGGIRTFGLAAILGEFACVFAALSLAPALLSLLRKRRSAGPATAPTG